MKRRDEWMTVEWDRSCKQWSGKVDCPPILLVAVFDPLLLCLHHWSWYFNLWPTQGNEESPTHLAHFHSKASKAQARMKQKRRKWGHVLFLSGFLPWLSLGPGRDFFYPWSCSLVSFIMIVLRRFLLSCEIPLLWCGSSPNRSVRWITSEEAEFRWRARI